MNDSIKNENKLSSSLKELQKEQTKNVFYGEHDIISRPGFDSIESFDKGIREVKDLIKDYDAILLDNQNNMKELVKDIDLYKNHPEIALPNEVEILNNKYASLLDKKNEYLSKQDKEKKNLEELLEAKKEFMRETRFAYKNEAKGKADLLKEYDAKQKEMKNLENKISMGMATELEKVRYSSLKNEIMPDIENNLNSANKNKSENAENSDMNSKTADPVVNEMIANVSMNEENETSNVADNNYTVDPADKNFLRNDQFDINKAKFHKGQIQQENRKLVSVISGFKTPVEKKGYIKRAIDSIKNGLNSLRNRINPMPNTPEYLQKQAMNAEKSYNKFANTQNNKTIDKLVSGVSEEDLINKANVR